MVAPPAVLAGEVALGVTSRAVAGAASPADLVGVVAVDAGMAFPADPAGVVTVGVVPPADAGMVTVGVTDLADVRAASLAVLGWRSRQTCWGGHRSCDFPGRCWV